MNKLMRYVPVKRSPSRWIIFVLGILSLGILLGAALLVAPPSRALIRRAWLVLTGGLVDVGGYRLRIECKGFGAPTVIMDSGLTFTKSTWGLVSPEIAKFTRVCTYDRAGLGDSDAGPKPRTSQLIVDELQTLLRNAGIDSPYVLVGHSFGGLNMRLYASEHPEQVFGLVLVDSSHEDADARLASILPPNRGREYLTRSQANSEGVDLETSNAQVRSSAPLPDVPMVVLMAARGHWPTDFPIDQAEVVRRELQLDLSRRVPHGSLIVAEEGGHFIQNDQPDLVAGAVRSVVEQVRALVAGPRQQSAAQTGVK